MLGRLVLFVFLLPFVLGYDGECTAVNVTKLECTCEDDGNYADPFLGGVENITELVISDCASVELGVAFFLDFNLLESITFRNIKTLAVRSMLPSQLKRLHIDSVNMESMTKDLFSGDTRLQLLRIHNSTIQEIKQDTFEYVAVNRTHFEHVVFHHLEVDALAFGFNMSQFAATDHADIFFNGCRFPDVSETPISVAEPGKIRFVNNVLDCKSLAQTYDWLHQMVGEQKQKGLLCHYLDENFCESRRDSNKVIRRLFDSGLLSSRVGKRLEDSCREQHQQYLYGRMKSHAGWFAQVNFTLLSLCFGAVLMGK